MLSDQFKSFSARKNKSVKLASTPFLFNMKDYPYAWSNTLRNHSFIYTNKEQIEKNLKRKKGIQNNKDKLYLGRYVRFTSGLEDSTLLKYEERGAPISGDMYETNATQKKYTEQIIELCNDKGIEIIFLTIPMYEKHISNYSNWKAKLKTVLGDVYSSKEYWIDLQSEGYEGFSKNSFENTYKKNQHMTYGGSLIATYKLIDFINDKSRINLPDRSVEEDWRSLFYNEEGFMENNTPRKNDAKNIILFNADKKGGVTEILMLKKKKQNVVILKFIPESQEQYEQLKLSKIRLNIVIKTNTGKVSNGLIDLEFDVFHSTATRMNFTRSYEPFEILKINKIQILTNELI